MSHSEGREAVEVFTSTSDKPYDRHTYRVVFKDGSKLDVETYDQAQQIWFNCQVKPAAIEVLSTPKAKSKASGGFG